jgi:hypothetical protein
MSTVESDDALAGLPVEEEEAGSKMWRENERQARGEAAAEADFSKGVAYIDGHYLPIAEAKIPVADWGFVRSDVTYDVVHVWKGSFFRLEDHIERFLHSVEGLRMTLPVSRHELRDVLIECVRLSGLRDAYVEMVCTRGQPPPGAPRHPRHATPNFSRTSIGAISAGRCGRPPTRAPISRCCWTCAATSPTSPRGRASMSSPSSTAPW